MAHSLRHPGLFTPSIMERRARSRPGPADAIQKSMRMHDAVAFIVSNVRYVLGCGAV